MPDEISGDSTETRKSSKSFPRATNAMVSRLTISDSVRGGCVWSLSEEDVVSRQVLAGLSHQIRCTITIVGYETASYRVTYSCTEVRVVVKTEDLGTG